MSFRERFRAHRGRLRSARWCGSGIFSGAGSRRRQSLARTSNPSNRRRRVPGRALPRRRTLRRDGSDDRSAGKRDHALLFECASLEATQIPFGARLLLVDTGTRHDLSTAGGPQRASRRVRGSGETSQGRASGAGVAGELAAEWLLRLKRALPEPLRSRAVHVVSETARARFAAQLLAQRKLKQFGDSSMSRTNRVGDSMTAALLSSTPLWAPRNGPARWGAPHRCRVGRCRAGARE